MIVVNNRIAVITKIYADAPAWRLKFPDTQEVVNVFYYNEEKWVYLLTSEMAHA